ncbi:hypothetical protein [Kitasatospora purpeofusca]|uniref:hypothetical protein n=1 Tax=Kitasatospora purpeofusca TaxID=67352 RepID=UPI000AB83B93|nr:hypothetical protein [Kitasatospora purpeofusca]
MVTFDRLRHAALAPLDRTGDTWNGLAGHAEQLAGQVRSGVLQPLTGAAPSPLATAGARAWTGVAADEATREIGLLADELTAFHYEALAVTAALRRAASVFTGAQQDLRRAIDDAEALGATVTTDGTVTLPPLPPEDRNDPDAIAYRRRQWEELQQHVEAMRKAVTAATEADAVAAAALRTLDPAEVDPATHPGAVAAAKADVIGAVGMPKDRKDIPAWWATVDPAVRAQLLELAPGRLLEAGVLDPTYVWTAPDSGAGPFYSREPGVGEHSFRAFAGLLVAGGTFADRTDAARNLQHFLEGTGEPLTVDVDRMLRDDPQFRDHVATLLTANDAQWRETALAAYQKSGGAPVAIPVETQRNQDNDYTFPEGSQPNWFTAVGSQACVLSGVVTVRPGPDGNPSVSMKYQVNVWDRYNWDAGKTTNIAGVRVSDSDMQGLHQTGLAQEYDLSGRSTPYDRVVGPGTPLVPKGTGERYSDREGGLADPGRETR